MHSSVSYAKEHKQYLALELVIDYLEALLKTAKKSAKSKIYLDEASKILTDLENSETFSFREKLARIKAEIDLCNA